MIGLSNQNMISQLKIPYLRIVSGINFSDFTYLYYRSIDQSIKVTDYCSKLFNFFHQHQIIFFFFFTVSSASWQSKELKKISRINQNITVVQGQKGKNSSGDGNKEEIRDRLAKDQNSLLLLWGICVLFLNPIFYF